MERGHKMENKMIMKGKYAVAQIMVSEIEESTRNQIQTFLNCPVFKDCIIRIMPDCHAGNGAVIGFTSTRNGYIIPNLVGVDIACGIETYKIGNLDELKTANPNLFLDLDNFIKANIPFGTAINDPNKMGHKIESYLKPKRCLDKNYLKKILCAKPFDFYGYSSIDEERIIKDIDDCFANPDLYREPFHELTMFLFDKMYELGEKVTGNPNYWKERGRLSLGSLGGGNHFIELDTDPDNNVWLSIHSGSRHFGNIVAQYHQDKAKNLISKFFVDMAAFKDLEFLPLDLGGQEYLDDMELIQQYALMNRSMMAYTIIKGFFGMEEPLDVIKTMHNYINFDDNIIRKGAISAYEGERVIIPIAMDTGAIIGTGKGNKTWNNSAPHGAGRIMSRNEARKTFTLEQHVKSMEGIWSSCINMSTIDETGGAYKSMDLIVNAITDTVRIDYIQKPVYVFKDNKPDKDKTEEEKALSI